MSPDSLYEIESEKSFLGSILLKGVRADYHIPIAADDLYVDLHKRIFTTILELIDQKIEIDPVSVINQLRAKARLKNEAEELEYIYNLYKDTVSVQPLSYYVERIHRLSEKRKYLSSLIESIDYLKSETDQDNEYIFSKIERDLTDISKAEVTKGLRNVREDKELLIDYIKNLFENKGQIQGLRTHFEELDKLTTGLKEHELMILAARPGNGKTTLALNIAGNIVLKENKPVAIFSLEMSRTELLLKMICADARIDSNLLKTGNLLKSDREKLVQSIIKISSAPLYIDDSGSLTVWEFKGKVRQLSVTEPLALIVVDYLQLMSDPLNKDGGRQQEVSSISRALKQIAKEARCPVLALSQMSRAVETRSKEQKPQLSDLRESGAIEQDADIVAFIYREELVKGKENISDDRKGIAEIIVAKNRAGSTGNFDLLFNPQYSKFDNIGAIGLGE